MLNYFYSLLDYTDKYGIRHNQLIVLDENMLNLKVTICRIPVSSASLFYAFSSLGFSTPGHKLGDLSLEESRRLNLTTYVEKRLVTVKNRQIDFTGCYFNVYSISDPGPSTQVDIRKITDQVKVIRYCL
jgi:hypothetical protein